MLGTYSSQTLALQSLPSSLYNLQVGVVISASRSRVGRLTQMKVSIATVHGWPAQNLGLPLLNTSESLYVSTPTHVHYCNHTPGKWKAQLRNATGILLASVFLIAWLAHPVKGPHHWITAVLRGKNYWAEAWTFETREAGPGNLVPALDW